MSSVEFTEQIAFDALNDKAQRAEPKGGVPDGGR